MGKVVRAKPRKKASTSPTQRSLRIMRDLGYVCQVVEHWNAFAKCRQDLFGIGDILCFISTIPGCTMIQATSTSNHSARITKALNNRHLEGWLQAGNRFQVQSWGTKRRISCFYFKEIFAGSPPGWRDIDLPDDDLRMI